MKKVMIHIIRLLSLTFLMLTASCEHETLLVENPERETVSEEKVQIEIFTRVNSYRLPATRGLEDEETVGKTPWVFVFKGAGGNARLIEVVQAFEMIKKRYVLLTKQADDSKYQLLILANPQVEFYYGDAVNGYEFNMEKLLGKMKPGVVTLSEVCENLLTEPLATPALAVMPFNYSGATIPMSYLLEVDRVDNTTQIANADGSPLLLVRSIAKMTVTNKAVNFELKGITAVVNVPRQGQLHNWGNSIMDNTSNLTEYRADAGYSAPLITPETVNDWQHTENSPVYLYESGIQNNTYLILQGTYEGKDYYYKMALIGSGKHMLDILRNHAYAFTINTVNGPGYDTVADAKASKASNVDIDYSILIDDSNTYEVVANNDYYLGVSNSVFIAYTDENKDHEAFEFITDCKTDFPEAKTIRDNENMLAGGVFGLRKPIDGLIPIVNQETTDPRKTAVEVYVSNWLKWYEDTQYYQGVRRDNAYITLKLGNLVKSVHIRQRDALPAGGTTLKYMPTGNTDVAVHEMNYYCLSAFVEKGSDNPPAWIKLRPSTGAARDDTESITVDDGKIHIEVLPNVASAPRTGIIYLVTIRDPDGSVGSHVTQRIKVSVTQLGKSIS
ncbi:DUF4906 domain-containing protein [Bacteroides clarus]|uniref:DUF4906 domain-containing protein n=1 Tax=Bacteroides clarus TaxID=626929 RepID=UPI0018984B6B|nr:DUF4906 domain-containing protein [Bacteroides clarus]